MVRFDSSKFEFRDEIFFSRRKIAQKTNDQKWELSALLSARLHMMSERPLLPCSHYGVVVAAFICLRTMHLYIFQRKNNMIEEGKKNYIIGIFAKVVATVAQMIMRMVMPCMSVAVYYMYM
jgi:hypothetical protein